MGIEFTNYEIIKRCEAWLTRTQEERWAGDDQAAVKIADALYHLGCLVLYDMQFLAQMGDAGLGHGAGPQIRRLLEISAVACDMQAHDDESLAEAVITAWQKSRGLTDRRVNQCWERIKANNSQQAAAIQRTRNAYNSESHFNLRERVAPASGTAEVRRGISMGYMVINAMALLREKHLPREQRTEATETAEELMDECGMALLREVGNS